MVKRREFVRTFAIASVGALVRAVPKSVPRSYDFEPVRQHILQAIAKGDATGVAVAVARGGSIIWEEGFGWANRESGLKAAANTPFTLASITKPFTTTTLMLLAAEGKLDLDDPANKYLRPSSVQGPNGNPEEATLRRLGAHIGGLPSMFEWYFPDKAQYSPPAESLLRDYGRLAYPPGRCNEYSNIGYVALGAVAANVAGMDFGSLMTRRVLEPLRLRDSFFGTNVERLKTSAARYDDSGNPIPYYTTSTPPSGELYASAHDLALFAMFNLKNDLALRSPILESRWIDELHKPVFVGQSGTAATFGWFLGQTKTGTQVVFKGGGQPGVSTMLYMVPSENLACLALTNRSNGSEAAFRVCDQIMATILPQWSKPNGSVGPQPSPLSAASPFFGGWEGMLSNGGAHMRVRLEVKSGDSATLALGHEPAEKLSDIRAEGTAFTGKAVAVIESADAIRREATNLSLKLMPQNGKLIGRILAMSKDGGTALPYVLTLSRLVGSEEVRALQRSSAAFQTAP
ncbi:MAG: serine hydrolase domain-containing protein [Terriglobia bacterium]